MKITAIISTYNRPDALKVILESILQQKIIPDEVIIADDGSGDETAEVISDFRKNFPVELNHVWHEDKGFRLAAIRNKAVKESSGDCLLFSDGDLIFHPKFFYDLKKNMSTQTALIGSRAFLTKSASSEILKNREINAIHFTSKKIEKNRQNAIRVPGISKILPYKKFTASLRGGLLCAWKDDIEAVNGWNENFVGWGKEDTEFVARLSFLGIKLKKLKFAGITYHLWHPVLSRKNVAENDKILIDTISSGNKWCTNGLIKSERI